MPLIYYCTRYDCWDPIVWPRCTNWQPFQNHHFDRLYSTVWLFPKTRLCLRWWPQRNQWVSQSLPENQSKKWLMIHIKGRGNQTDTPRHLWTDTFFDWNIELNYTVSENEYKSYVNEVTLREQNLYWNPVNPLNWTYVC